MLKSKLARAVINELREKIAVAEKRKEKIVSYYYYIYDRYRNHEITHEEYVLECEKEFDGRTLDEWIKHYDSYISYLQGELKNKTRRISKSKILVIFSFLIAALMIFLPFFITPSNLVGLAVLDKDTEISESSRNDTEIFVGGINIINDTIAEENVTEEVIEIVVEENLTGDVNITTIQLSAVLGEPVKWIKHVELDSPQKTIIKLPNGAKNVSVNDIEDGNLGKFTITGAVVGSSGENWFTKFIEFLKRNFGRITGAIVIISSKVEGKISKSTLNRISCRNCLYISNRWSSISIRRVISKVSHIKDKDSCRNVITYVSTYTTCTSFKSSIIFKVNNSYSIISS